VTRSLICARAFLLLLLLSSIVCREGRSQEKPQEKPKETVTAEQPAPVAPERKNPIKPTPETLAEAKKFFGYDCAMCHGVSGDGKGDLAPSMGLKMNDWRGTSAIASMSDSQIFDVIVKGKGKMEGEGDRMSPEIVWKIVNFVRSLSKKESANAPNGGASR
jgi:mono/diheme cytochrome c family protein